MPRFSKISKQDREDHAQEKLIRKLMPNADVELKYTTKNGTPKNVDTKADFSLDDQIKEGEEGTKADFVSGGDSRKELERDRIALRFDEQTTPQHRAVLSLIYQWGMTYAEISSILGLSQLEISSLHDESMRAQKEIQSKPLLQDSSREETRVRAQKVPRGLQKESRFYAQEGVNISQISTEKRARMEEATEKEIHEEVLDSIDFGAWA